MRNNVVRTAVLVAAILTWVAAAHAQEGYPLTGTWYGEYGTGSAKKDITLVLKWDGSKASGITNPGPGSQPITSATLDIIPGKAGGRSLNNPDAAQAVPPVFNVKIVIGDVTLEGKMMNPVGGNRSIVGTYTRGTEKGPFQIKHL
jgi:hypothetical protein